MLEMLGLEGKNWLGTDMKFWSMLFAFIFGAVGYYMLIFISGIERIPEDLYEAATIDGANKVQQFFSMTLPLLRSIFKTNITFWSVNCITFFLWSKMFSPVQTETSTVVPVVYLYDTVFGTTGNVQRDAGAGAAGRCLFGTLCSSCLLCNEQTAYKMMIWNSTPGKGGRKMSKKDKVVYKENSRGAA